MNAAQVWLMAGALAAVACPLALAAAYGRTRTVGSLALLRAVRPLFLFLVPAAVLVGAKGHCEDWDGARLCAAVAWIRGFPVYAGLDAGAIQTSMYPPGWLLAYAPAALGQTPAAVMQIGNLLAPLYFLLPFFLLKPLLRIPRGLAGLAVAAIVFAASQVEPLWWACFSPHADAPALGLGLLAVLLLQGGERGDRRRGAWFAAAALAAALAVWCKQVMLPLLPALVMWLLVRRQPRRAWQLCLALAAAGALLAVISCLLFPARDLWLNLVVIPGHHPWKGRLPFNLLSVMLALLRPGLLPAILLGCNTVLALVLMPRGAWRDWALRGAWLPALLAFAWLVPISAMGLVKEGGALNSLSPALYFLYAAAVLQWVELFTHARQQAAEPRLLAAFAAGTALAAWCCGGYWWLQTMQELRYGLHDLRTSLNHRAFVYLASGHAPRAYFPAYPLAHLLAEDRLYHFVQGMADRDQAGRVPIGTAQREAHLPAGTEVVCWTARQFGSEHGRGQAYFPAFTRPRNVPALPDFTCFAAEAPTP